MARRVHHLNGSHKGYFIMALDETELVELTCTRAVKRDTPVAMVRSYPPFGINASRSKPQGAASWSSVSFRRRESNQKI